MWIFLDSNINSNQSSIKFFIGLLGSNLAKANPVYPKTTAIIGLIRPKKWKRPYWKELTPKVAK